MLTVVEAIPYYTAREKMKLLRMNKGNGKKTESYENLILVIQEVRDDR